MNRLIPWLLRNLGTTLLFLAGCCIILAVLLVDPYELYDAIPTLMVAGFVLAVTLVAVEGRTGRAVLAERRQWQAVIANLTRELEAVRDKMRASMPEPDHVAEEAEPAEKYVPRKGWPDGAHQAPGVIDYDGAEAASWPRSWQRP